MESAQKRKTVYQGGIPIVGHLVNRYFFRKSKLDPKKDPKTTKRYAAKAIEILQDDLSRAKSPAKIAKLQRNIAHWEKFIKG